jgi:hypothetical protein
VLIAYARDLAERRFEQGFDAAQVCEAAETLNRVCLKALLRDPEGRAHAAAIRDHLTMTLRLACDEVQEVYEHLEAIRDGRMRSQTI